MNEIVDSLVSQARHYLKELGEFYPFGAAITAENELKPVGVQMDNEYPESTEVIKVLAGALLKGIEEKKYRVIGICTDILYTLNEKRSDALELRVLELNHEPVNYYCLYDKLPGGEIHISEIIKEKGSLRKQA